MTVRSRDGRNVPAAGALILLIVCVSLSQGQLPRIRLDSVFPPGGRAGSEVEVQISGELTEAATELVFSDPGIVATQKIVGPTEFTVAHRRPRTFNVHVGADVPDGLYDVRALGSAGLSGPRTFVVSRLTQRDFDGSGNSRQEPFPLSVGQVVNAKSRADQRDYYSFVGIQGQPILIQVWADRIDSKTDASCAIYDGASRKRLLRATQSITRDPIMTFVPPQDGEYVVEVWDATYRGGDEYVYRLEISTGAQVEAIHPAVAQAGYETDFTVYGFNLPGGAPVSGSAPLGNLQALSLTFAPVFGESKCAEGPSRLRVCSARVDGGAVSLPVPLSTRQVLLARARQKVIPEAANNDDVTEAQMVRIPCHIAGQFYPRRDIDWYQFEAHKGQIVWIEVSTQQLGTNADPTLRVARSEEIDGRIELRDIATADDIEGAPSSRDSRRLYSGTNDAAVRFHAPEDGTYVVSVTDQYNATQDDPRLVYRLSILPKQPDFQLLAYADPERHGDVKIVKPNGVSLLPGGSAAVRVRLLPLRGFDAAVHVSAVELPVGVTAHPLILSSRHREGLLVLTADEQAKPSHTPIQVRGHTQVGDQRWSRQASLGAIVRGVNNADVDATHARLTGSLLVTVVDSKPSPVQIRPPTMNATCVGGQFTLPIRLARSDELKDQELQIEASSLPSGFQVATNKTKGSTVDMLVKLDDPKLPAGQYTLGLSANVKQKRPKNALLAQQAAADLEKVAKLAESRTAELQSLTTKLAQIRDSALAAKAAFQQQLAATEEPRNQLAAVLRTQRQAAIELADRLQAAVEDVANSRLREAVIQAEENLLRAQSQRERLQASLTAAVETLPALERSAAEKEDAHVQQEMIVKTATAKRDEAVQKRQAAEKVLADVNKAQLEQEAEFWIYSPTVIVDVRPTPVTLHVAGDIRVGPGQTVEIPMSLHRQFGFTGQVALSADFPMGSGLTAPPVVAGEGQRVVKLVVTAASDAEPGARKILLLSQLHFNDLDLSSSTMAAIDVVAKEPTNE